MSVLFLWHRFLMSNGTVGITLQLFSSISDSLQYRPINSLSNNVDNNSLVSWLKIDNFFHCLLYKSAIHFYNENSQFGFIHSFMISQRSFIHPLSVKGHLFIHDPSKVIYSSMIRQRSFIHPLSVKGHSFVHGLSEIIHPYMISQRSFILPWSVKGHPFIHD